MSSAEATAKVAKPEKVRVFRITDIPDVMDKRLGWPVAAKVMRRWFANSVYEMPQSVKEGKTDPRTMSAFHIDEQIVTMKWALGFSRVNKAYQQLFNGWKTPAGLNRLRELIVPVNPTNTSPWRFGDLSQPGKVLDKTCQVNRIEVGSLSDPLDDFYGAMGKAVLKLAVTGIVTPLKPRRNRIAIDAVGVYLRDTYDFNDDATDLISQPLGYWGFQGVARGVQLRWDIEIEEKYANKEDEPAERLYAVQNDDFRSYQDKYGRGGDFVIYSDVHRERLLQPLVLEV
ncbi:MAG: hypothetical protein HY308_07805 [Gammaproteobacteria bacterium]|nr:hypothetical protein [Gammaproteobacteria bacterium]